MLPTDIRSLSHGISAASGKLGALISTLLFSSRGPQRHDDGHAGHLLGLLRVRLCRARRHGHFCARRDRLVLQSIDDKWDDILRSKQYHGPARNPKYLSLRNRKTSRCSCEQCLSETRTVRPAKVLADAPQQDLSAV
jgi:hypothetical protein